MKKFALVFIFGLLSIVFGCKNDKNADEISVNGDSFLDAIKLAKGFSLDNYSVLKKMPKGFDNVNENWQFLLKHKVHWYILTHQ